MWGILVGLAIGALQVVALYKLGKMILGGNPSVKVVGAFLLIVKIAIIVFILCLIANITLMHLIWTAVGMLFGMIAALVVVLHIRHKADTANDSHTDGKDINHG